MKSILFWILTASVLSLVAAGFLHPVTAFTQDLGRHFLMGRIIVDTHTVPKTNLLSYTYPDHPFINHHYFSQVIFYLSDQLVGINGLLLMMTGVVILAFGIVFLYSAYKTSILPVSIVAFFYVRVLFERTDVRPEMFGYLLLSSFVVLLYQYRERYSKSILLLIPLTFLWVQLHISFIIGLIVLGLFFIDHAILHHKKMNNPSTRLFFIVLICSYLVTLINPNGLSGALYPLHIFQNYGYQIEENQNIFFLESLFSKPTIPYFKLSVLLLFISLFSIFKKTKLIDWLLAITFTYLAASAVRNFPLFVFATCIPASYALWNVWTWINSQIAPQYHRRVTTALSIILTLLFLWTIPSVASVREFGLGTVSGAEKAADFYIKNNLQGPVFNNFDIGSYLAYRTFPTQKVFIDGRPEAYPASFFQQTYIPMQQDPTFFAQKEKEYHFNTIFFSHTDQTPWASTFILSIMQNNSWVPIYLDHDVIILVRNHADNKDLLTKYGMNRETLTPTDTNSYTTRELMQLINFYVPLHNNTQILDSANKILTREQNNCPVLSYILSSGLLSSEKPEYQIYAHRYTLFCR